MSISNRFSRRGLIKVCGCAAAGIAAESLARSASSAPVSPPDVVDVHYHVMTKRMRVLAQGSGAPIDTIADWEAAPAIDEMGKAGVRLAVISMPVVSTTIPGGAKEHVHFANAANEDASNIVERYPDSFRFFGFLPMPYIDETLNALSYVLDTLKAEGVYMCTSYGNKWLGDAEFAPVMEELNRRGAIVYTHPMGASCCAGSLVSGVLPPIIEYGTDTARSIASLIFNGAQQRYPNIKFLFSHAGGSAPYLYERFEGYAQTTAANVMPNGARAAFSHFFYDTAQAVNPYALGTLAKLVPDTQILFGSDVPWNKQRPQLEAMNALQFSGELLRAIRYGNAERIMPDLRSS